MYDVVPNYTSENVEHRSQVRAVNDGELKRAAGVHHTDPIFDIKDGTLVTEDIKENNIGLEESINTYDEKDEIIGNLQNIHTMLDETSQYQNTNILQNNLNE